MTKFFLRIYDYFQNHKGFLITFMIGITLLFVGMASQVRFVEDISGFLPEDKANERINNAYRYVATANKITIFCSGEDTTEQSAFAQIEAVDLLAEQLQKLDTSLIRQLFYKVDPTKMAEVTAYVVQNMPYFLDENDYKLMDSLITTSKIASQLSNDKEILLSPLGMVLRQSILCDPLRISNPLMKKLQSFQIGEQFVLYQDHIFTDDHRALLVIDCPMPVSEANRNAQLLDSLTQYINKVEKELEGKVSFQRLGASEIALGNATQIKKDTLFSSALAVLLIFLLLVYSFRSGKKIILIFASVLFGGLFAMAFLYLIRGEVSIIAVGISSIMFGIALNYPLHFVEHHNHLPNSRLVIKDIVAPLTIGNITTVGAFLSLVFIGSTAMADLGWFASLLLVGSILFVLLFLPHLLSQRKKSSTNHSNFLVRLTEKPFEKNRWLITAVLLLTVFFSFFSGESRFETNMQKINYMTPEQQKEYQHMMEVLNKNQHILYCVTEGNNLNETLEANEKLQPLLDTLKSEGKLIKISGIQTFFPSAKLQAERVERWNTFWESRKNQVWKTIEEESANLGFKPQTFQQFEQMINQTWQVTDLSHFDFIREVLAKNYIQETPGQSMVINMLYTEPQHVSQLEERLNSFSDASISFDAGSITRRMVASLSDNFNYVLYVCGIIVFAFLIFSLGRFELSLIAFIPLALSWVWILGMMNLFDIRFNIVNIILATFIFGQGDDYTIFMTEGLMYEYTYRRKILSSYKNSIALSALIMFIGIGTLIFAKHPALRSLAEVTIVGMFSVVIMSYIFPSLLFRLLTSRKGKARLMPVTFKNLFATIYAFVFFLLMSTLLTIGGWFLFTFGKKTAAKRMRYHQWLHQIARFVIFRVPQVHTTFVNLTNETFDKPSVIICNHQSHLDLMCVMMLTPKLIILTNNWVWNSPFYGRLIKYADFYPASEGIEKAITKLKGIVEQGYSIVIFPEGTRSEDCSIRRFHRGAFFLAEQLKLDIVPVMIHGVGHVLPKQEFMLRKGNIHIEVMEKILLNDQRFSPDYSARSKEVRRYYKERYEALSKQLETPEYFTDLVRHNYIYKGPSVERQVAKNLHNNQNLLTYIQELPEKGKALVLNSGYGELSLLLALAKKEWEVIAVEENDDLRELAANCSSVPENLYYTSQEPELDPEEFDCCLTFKNGVYEVIH